MDPDVVTTDREFEGTGLEDALRSASAALGMAPDAFRYSIVEDGRRGLFGFGARRVRIRVRVEPAERVESPAGPPAGTEDRASISGSVVATVRELLGLMGLDLRAEAEAHEAAIRIVLDGPDRKLLTQREGELLGALQFVLNRMSRRAWPGAGHVLVECKGYRDRREEDVVELVREVARQVARTGRPKKLHSMNPYERRLVHLTVKEFPDLTSHSAGDGFLKQVTVAPASSRGPE